MLRKLGGRPKFSRGASRREGRATTGATDVFKSFHVKPHAKKPEKLSLNVKNRNICHLNTNLASEVGR